MNKRGSRYESEALELPPKEFGSNEDRIRCIAPRRLAAKFSNFRRSNVSDNLGFLVFEGEDSLLTKILPTYTYKSQSRRSEYSRK